MITDVINGYKIISFLLYLRLINELCEITCLCHTWALGKSGLEKGCLYEILQSIIYQQSYSFRLVRYVYEIKNDSKSIDSYF